MFDNRDFGDVGDLETRLLDAIAALVVTTFDT
jgi:hypothetical protein